MRSKNYTLVCTRRSTSSRSPIAKRPLSAPARPGSDETSLNTWRVDDNLDDNRAGMKFS